MLKQATKLAPQPLALENAYRAGFRHTELWLGPAVLAALPTVVRHCLHYPMSYALHFPNRLDLSAEMLENTVSLYRQLGSRCLIIHQPMYDKFREHLLKLGPELKLAVENHKLTVDGIEDWANKNVGLTLDVEHLWKFTLKDAPAERLFDHVRTFLTRHAEKLRHVHLPGYWPGFQEHRPMYCSRDMVFPILTLLAEARFEGLIVSEAEMEYQNPHELRMDVLLFETWREQCEKKFVISNGGEDANAPPASE